MENLFQPLGGCLENINENNILDKEKQLILDNSLKIITCK